MPRQLPGLGAGGEHRRVPARCDTAAKQQHVQQPKDDKDSIGLPNPQWGGEGRTWMTALGQPGFAGGPMRRGFHLEAHFTFYGSIEGPDSLVP